MFENRFNKDVINRTVVPKLSLYLSNDYLFPKTNTYNALKILELLDRIGDKKLKEKDSVGTKKMIVIGLLNDNIAVPNKDGSFREVIGYSCKKYNACVISKYKFKDYRYFANAVIHEFIHVYLKYGHCPQNHPNCVMFDDTNINEDTNADDFYRAKFELCDVCKGSMRRLIKPINQ